MYGLFAQSMFVATRTTVLSKAERSNGRVAPARADWRAALRAQNKAPKA